MNKNKNFSFKRFALLLKKEAHINIKRNLLIIGAMYSLFTIVMLLIFKFNKGNYTTATLENFHFVVFTAMLFTAGVFITSFSFIELRDKMKSQFYLLTPSSNFEKFAVNLLISFFGYLLFMLISYLSYSWIFNWTALRIYNIPFSPLNIGTKDFFLVINIFIIVHSIFFLGSVSFKKYPIIITPIACFIAISAITIFNKIAEKIIFSGLELKGNMPNIDFDDYHIKYKIIAKIILYYVFPIILWFIAYLKLNEKEY